MKLDIILAGVGGQGILSIATVIGYAAVESGLSLKQAEVHGMSQRGGDVQSHLRISDKTIYSDLVPEGAADIILSVEPMESLRYIPYLSPEGWLVTNTTPYKNIANYPDLDAVLKEVDKVPQHVAIDADGTAKDLKNPRGMNMVMTGAASLFMNIDFEKLKEGIRYSFGRKGQEIVNLNIATLEAGRKFAEENRSS